MIGITSTSPIAASRAFGHQLALATFRGSPLFGYDVRLFDPFIQTWMPPVAMANLASAPQLVWDGTALNGFYVRGGQVFHVFSTSNAPLVWREQVQVTNGFALANGQYHVETFNGCLHLAYLLGAADPSFNPVYYTTAYTPFGQRSTWAPPSYTGFNAKGGPRVATVYDQLYVVANAYDGKPRCARKDPNKKGNNQTGGTSDDRWLEAGWPADDRGRLGVRRPGRPLLQRRHLPGGQPSAPGLHGRLPAPDELQPGADETGGDPEVRHAPHPR